MARRSRSSVTTSSRLTPTAFNPNVQLTPTQFEAGKGVANPSMYADALKSVAQEAVNLTGTMEKAQNTSINFFKDAMEDLQAQLQPLAMDANEKNRMLQELAAGITALTALNQDMAEGKFDTQEKRDTATAQAHQFTSMLKEVTNTIAAKAPKEDKEKADEQMRRFRAIDERRDTSIKYQQNLDARMMSQLMTIGTQFSEQLKVLQTEAGTAAAKGTPEGQQEFEAIQVKIKILMENIAKNATTVMTKTSEQQTNILDKASEQLQSNVAQRAKEMARTWAAEKKKMIAENFKAKTVADLPEMLDLDRLFGTLTESFSFGDIKEGFDFLRGKTQTDADAAKAAEVSAAELGEINNNITGLRQDTEAGRRFYEKQVALYQDRQSRYEAAIDAITSATGMDAAQVEAYKKSAAGVAMYQQAGSQAEAAFQASEQAKQAADASYIIDNIKLVNAIDVNGIPMLAEGGAVERNSIVNVAEKQSELVIPLDRVKELTDLSDNLVAANAAAETAIPVAAAPTPAAPKIEIAEVTPAPGTELTPGAPITEKPESTKDEITKSSTAIVEKLEEINLKQFSIFDEMSQNIDILRSVMESSDEEEIQTTMTEFVEMQRELIRQNDTLLSVQDRIEQTLISDSETQSKIEANSLIQGGELASIERTLTSAERGRYTVSETISEMETQIKSLAETTSTRNQETSKAVETVMRLAEQQVKAVESAESLVEKVNKSRAAEGKTPIAAERKFRNEGERTAAEDKEQTIKVATELANIDIEQLTARPEASIEEPMRPGKRYVETPIPTAEIPTITPQSTALEREIIATRSVISELEKQLETITKKQSERGMTEAKTAIKQSYRYTGMELTPELEAFLVKEVENVLNVQTTEISKRLEVANTKLTELIDKDITEKKVAEEKKKTEDSVGKVQALPIPKFGPKAEPITSTIIGTGEANLEPIGEIADALTEEKTPGPMDSAKGTSAPIAVGPINSKRTPEGRILQATIETGAAQWKKLDEIADLLRQKDKGDGKKGKEPEKKGTNWLDWLKNLLPLLALLLGALLDPAAFLKGFFKWIPDFFKKFRDLWEKIAKKIGDIIDRLKLKFGDIKNRIKKFIDDFLEKFREFKGRIKRFFDDLFSGKFFQDLKAKLGKIGDNIKKFFDDLFSGKLLSDMKKSLSDSIDKISKAVGDFTSDLKKTLKIEEIKKWFGEVFSMKTAAEMKKIAMKWWSDLWSGELARSLMESAKKGFGEVVEKSKAGLKGIKEFPGKATSKIGELARGAKGLFTGGAKAEVSAQEQLFQALMKKNPAATIARDDVAKYVSEFARINKVTEEEALTKLLEQAGVSTGGKVAAKTGAEVAAKSGGKIAGLARTVSHGVGTGAGFKAGFMRNIGFGDQLFAKLFNPNDEEGAAIDIGAGGLGGMIAGGTTRALGMNPARMGATGNALSFLGNVWLQSALGDQAKDIRAKMKAGKDVTALEKAQYYGTAGAGYAGEAYLGGKMTMGALEQMRLAQAATQGRGFGAIGASLGAKGVQSSFGAGVGSKVAGPLAAVFSAANIARNLGAFGEGAQDMDMKVAQETGDKFYQSMKIMNDVSMAIGSFFGPLGTVLGMGAGSLGMSAAMLRNPSINKEVAMREVVADQQERKAKAQPFVESADAMRKKMREEGAAKGMDIVKIQEKLSRKEAVTEEERKYSEEYNKLYKITNVMTKAAEMNLKQTGANTWMQKLANMPDWATAATTMIPGVGALAVGAKAYVGETKEPDKKAVYGATLDELQKAFKEAIASQDSQLAANIQGAMKTFVETNATQVGLSQTFSSAAVDMRSVLTENQNLTKQDTETFNKALDGLQKDAAKPMVAIQNAIDEIGKIQDVEARTDAYLKLQELIKKSGEGIDNQNQLMKKLDETMNEGIGVDRDLIKTMKTMNKGPAEIKAELLQALKGIGAADGGWFGSSEEDKIAKMNFGSKELTEYVSSAQFAGLKTLLKDKGGMTETDQTFITEQMKKKGYSDEAITKVLAELERQLRTANEQAAQQKTAQEQQKAAKAERVKKEEAAKATPVTPAAPAAAPAVQAAALPPTAVPAPEAQKAAMAKISVAMTGTTPMAETIKTVTENMKDVSVEQRTAIIKQLNEKISSTQNVAQREKLSEMLKTSLEKVGVSAEGADLVATVKDAQTKQAEAAARVKDMVAQSMEIAEKTDSPEIRIHLYNQIGKQLGKYANVLGTETYKEMLSKVTEKIAIAKSQITETKTGTESAATEMVPESDVAATPTPAPIPTPIAGTPDVGTGALATPATPAPIKMPEAPAGGKGTLVVKDPNSAKDSTAQQTNSLLGQLVDLFKNFDVSAGIVMDAAKIPSEADKALMASITPGATTGAAAITKVPPPTETSVPAKEASKVADKQMKAADAQADAAEKQKSLAKQVEEKADKEKQAIDKDIESKLSKMDEMKESYLLKTVLGEDVAQMGIDVSAPLAEGGPEASGAAAMLGIPQGEFGKMNVPGVQSPAAMPSSITAPSPSPSISNVAQSMATTRMPSADNMTINNTTDNKDDLGKVIELLGKIAKNTADGGSNPPPPPASRPNQTYRR